MKHPCILFALARERRPFCKRFPLMAQVADAPCPAWRCGQADGSLLVVETGVGHERTARALDWVFSQPTLGCVAHTPSVLIFAGFAGALSADLKIGDVVLADEIVDDQGNGWPTTWPPDWPASTVPLVRGRLLSAPRLIGDPQEKRRLGKEHSALAVDMESAIFARRCHERGVPFECVRAISDDVDTRLSPELLRVLTGGRIAWGKLTLTLMRRPWLVKEMMALGRNTRLAAENLANMLSAMPH